MAVITTRKLTKQFGGLVAIDTLDLEVREHSIHSVIGPNGAGKTTLFNCITGFYRPEIGEILLDDRSLVGFLPDQIVQRGVARTYQNIRLFSNLTAVENILVGLHSHLKAGFLGIVTRSPATRKEEKEANEEALRLLKFVGLSGKGDLLSKNLPYGDQRRLEIARALATRPKVLLLDEPSMGLSPIMVDKIFEVVSTIHGQGTTVLLVEQDVKNSLNLSDRGYVLEHGRTVMEGPARELLENPHIRTAYLGL